VATKNEQGPTAKRPGEAACTVCPTLLLGCSDSCTGRCQQPPHWRRNKTSRPGETVVVTGTDSIRGGDRPVGSNLIRVGPRRGFLADRVRHQDPWPGGWVKYLPIATCAWARRGRMKTPPPNITSPPSNQAGLKLSNRHIDPYRQDTRPTGSTKPCVVDPQSSRQQDRAGRGSADGSSATCVRRRIAGVINFHHPRSKFDGVKLSARRVSDGWYTGHHRGGSDRHQHPRECVMVAYQYTLKATSGILHAPIP